MAQSQGAVAVDIDDVTKLYGNFTALSAVSLAIHDNEFFTLLGPSGCGKTTLLRCIAGFEDISQGAIRLYGDNIADLPPNHRPVNTVFQQYALFPHMDVTRNVMFGLLRLGRSEAEARARAGEVLELVRLSEFANRMPAQLSGGQQQRVALARALAPNPKVLLLDEPLSALDLKLRQAVRLELQQLQHETGITFIFVTHDQEEALTMSDRIAVISDGKVQQVGSARDIYEEPDNKFVADFIGETNLIDVSVAEIAGDKALCTLPGGTRFTCPAARGAHSGQGHLSVRPERVSLADPAGALLTGTVTRLIYLGTDMHVDMRLSDGESITARVQNSSQTTIPAMGDTVGLDFEEGAARLLVD
ncbi:ABC transporter ATP-binding protein [Aquicoccus porphyridii]|uniref:ABC transporter ATP-binding protein n=1 Tax=Aquicoccus porphyridii TaxID=1852029 RepID=A0A5A9ZG53_9RHOB|nr:ABC transporter ATP-binding protein [Aquicoccus porphyridii]KAA0916223.1 ABC transporter ATP-binding protein [Aquicoccus porphyridii]RAI53646.1 spermidine/putrescine ABC transporter ATP-binding protein [Rhodobacteraceae bacterium AsT-22]